jgi:hypothetical protein
MIDGQQEGISRIQGVEDSSETKDSFINPLNVRMAEKSRRPSG